MDALFDTGLLSLYFLAFLSAGLLVTAFMKAE